MRFPRGAARLESDFNSRVRRYNVLIMLTFPTDLTRSAALIHRQDAATRPPLVTFQPCQAGDTVGMAFILDTH